MKTGDCEGKINTARIARSRLLRYCAEECFDHGPFKGLAGCVKWSFAMEAIRMQSRSNKFEISLMLPICHRLPIR
jgi:hypothetical protein